MDNSRVYPRPGSRECTHTAVQATNFLEVSRLALIEVLTRHHDECRQVTFRMTCCRKHHTIVPRREKPPGSLIALILAFYLLLPTWVVLNVREIILVSVSVKQNTHCGRSEVAKGLWDIKCYHCCIASQNI